MRINRFLCVTLLVGSSALVGSASAAKRYSTPSEGHPEGFGEYGSFNYLNGVVRHINVSTVHNWYLVASVDSGGAKTATVRAKGNNTTGTTCYGTTFNVEGGGTVGGMMTTPAGCGGVPSGMALPSVTVPSNGAFGVICQLPRDAPGCDPRIAMFNYDR